MGRVCLGHDARDARNGATTKGSILHTVTLETAPSVARLFAKAPLAARHRSVDVPDTQLVLADVAVDRDHLARYNRVCGFTLRDTLPPTFVHVLAFPLQMALMVEHPFPLSLAKLVHVRNHITQRRPVAAGECLVLTVRAENLRAHPKGAAVDLVADATADGEAVWHGVSTYLQRGSPPSGASTAAAATEGGDGASEPAPAGGNDESEVPDDPAAVWRVPRDIGRRYAAVSGDYNPIHLNPLAAKLAGFPRTIAHGMWTKSRALSAIESRLPDACTVDVSFDKPIVLPVTIGFHTRARDDVRAVAVRDLVRGRSHLRGQVRRLATR